VPVCHLQYLFCFCVGVPQEKVSHSFIITVDVYFFSDGIYIWQLWPCSGHLWNMSTISKYSVQKQNLSLSRFWWPHNEKMVECAKWRNLQIQVEGCLFVAQILISQIIFIGLQLTIHSLCICLFKLVRCLVNLVCVC